MLCFLIFFAGIMRDDVQEKKYVELGAKKQFDCVGAVFNAKAPSGSGVLISRRYVLSAAHVFMEYNFKTDSVTMGGQVVVVNSAVSAKPINPKLYLVQFGDKVYKCKSVIVHPSYDWKARTYDMALLELETEVTGIEPATLNTKLDEMGSLITGVGYGASGYGRQPETVLLSHKKIGGQNIVDSIGGPKLNNLSTLLFCDFDDPAHPELNATGSKIATNLEYFTSGGDSGGGMFRQSKKRWELIGICHSGDVKFEHILKSGYYGSLMSFSRVSAYIDWIRQTIAS